jgi:hypothetical protein
MAPMNRTIMLNAMEHALDSVHCMKCDYSLRGLMLGGQCPECGTAILASYNRAEEIRNRKLLMLTACDQNRQLSIVRRKIKSFKYL